MRSIRTLAQFEAAQAAAKAKKAAKKPARLKQSRKKRLPLPDAVYEAKVAGRSCRVPDCQGWPIDAHHLVEVKHFDHDNPEQHNPANLIPVCRDHHANHHSKMQPLPWAILDEAEKQFIAWAKPEAWARKAYS